MTAPMIAIVGARGAVGGAALAGLLIDGRHALRAGYHARPLGDGLPAAVERRPVDTGDAASLARFCEGCAVVLNAAGPSYRIGDSIARAADAAGADYVDAFGGAPLVRQLQSRPLAARRRVIHSAGVYPGLSTLLPRWLGAREFAHVDAVRGWAGGRERCTLAAAADVLASTVQGFGHADAVWLDGRRQLHATMPEADVSLAGFPGRVHVQPFLDLAFEQLAAEWGLREARWHNVMPDTHARDVIGRWRGRLGSAAALDDALLARASAELVATAALDVAGAEPYYRLMIEIDGREAGRTRRLRAVLRASDSYRVSGAVAASAALQLLHAAPAPGIHGAERVLAWDLTLAHLHAWAMIEAFSLVELPALAAPRGAPATDEGTL